MSLFWKDSCSLEDALFALEGQYVPGLSAGKTVVWGPHLMSWYDAMWTLDHEEIYIFLAGIKGLQVWGKAAALVHPSVLLTIVPWQLLQAAV